MTDHVIRPIKEEELDCLDEFLYQAIFVPKGMKRPDREIVQRPELQVYTEGFGTKEDDHCLVAECDGRVIGAVWVRIMDDYGHIDDDVPSLAISLLPEYRGKGIGTALLGGMLDLLRKKGYPQVSLSVQKDNPAVGLYEKAGFQVYVETEEEFIMTKDLTRDFEIREVRKEDLHDFMRVNTICWVESYRGIMDDAFLNKIMDEIDLNAKRQEEEYDRVRIEEPDYKRFLLFVEGEAAGTCAVCRSRDERYPDAGELANIYLLDKVKKQGYGKLLFERAVDELKKSGYRDMIIGCLKDNPANAFYSHMGGQLMYSYVRKIGGRDLVENIWYFEKI